MLSRFGLSFETWLYHPQIGDLTDLARAFPETKILIDHSGGPLGVGPYRGKRDEVFARWSASLKTLAACPNVYIKVGGLGQPQQGFDFNERADPPSSRMLADAFRPYVENVYRGFWSFAVNV